VSQRGLTPLTFGAGLEWTLSYTAPPMAVPKKKTSKARRDKRRAQHKIEAPRLNVCPQCGRPKRPHRVCPTCHTYRGRDVEPLRTPAP
jgi:large subunit ribosomal protein L32